MTEKVLIIDDEDDVRQIAGLSLSHVGGFEVVEASSGLEGIEVARREKPDVILLDVMMPNLTGPATLERMRDDPELCDVRVIFMTARAMVSEVENLKSLGAQGVLTKPFDAMKLPDDLRKLLR